MSFLAQALALNSQPVFIDYVGWAKVVLQRRNVLASDLAFHFELLAEILRERLPSPTGGLAAAFVSAAVQAIPDLPDDIPTFMGPCAPLSPLAHQYCAALLRSDRQLASRLILDAVAAGTSVKDVYLHVFQACQREIGRLWQIGRITVAQEHFCTAATQLVMSQLYSHVFATTRNGNSLVATSVAGDLHEIGIRMVADFFEMAGWDTCYLGASTPHESVVRALADQRADVVAVSTTLAFHLEAVRELIVTIRRDPVVGKIKVLVGGPPFSRYPDLWRELGADGSASDAQEAIDLANRMMQGAPG